MANFTVGSWNSNEFWTWPPPHWIHSCLAPEGSQSEQGLGQGLSCSISACTCICLDIKGIKHTIITIIYIYIWCIWCIYIYTIDIPSLYTCYHIPCPSSHQAIGVTNYSLRHLKQLMKTCKIKRLGSAWATGRVGKIPDSERKWTTNEPETLRF